jgi:hypothetical protein
MTSRSDQRGKVLAPALARMLRYCCDRNLQIDAVSISPLTLRSKIQQTLGMHEPLDGREALAAACAQGAEICPTPPACALSCQMFELRRHRRCPSQR